MSFGAKKNILALALEHREFRALEITPSGAIARQARASLAVNPLTGETDLSAREIRDALDAAGIRPGACTLSLPIGLALSMRVEIPEAVDPDPSEFLRLEAEGFFPYALEDMQYQQSVCALANGRRIATLFGIPRAQTARLEEICRLAGLRLQSLTFGFACLALECREPEALHLLLRENGGAAMITAGGGIAFLRSLDETFVEDEGETRLDIDQLLRELRINLRQLPGILSGETRPCLLHSAPDLSAEQSAALEDGLRKLGLAPRPADPDASLPVLSKLARAAALSHLKGGPRHLEMLPPRVSLLRQLAERYSVRGMAWAAGALAGLALMFGGLYVHQYLRWSALDSEWKGIAAQVAKIEARQNFLRKYGGWFRNEPLSLQILRAVTRAFPEDGAVWVKNLELREQDGDNLKRVSCSGQARGNREWLQAREKLSQTPGIEKLEVQQVRGEAPLQFSFTFTWNGQANP